MKPALLLCMLMLLAGCGPSIGLKTDFANQGFEVGRTTRDEVIEKLGLPQKRQQDTDGRDHLFYAGATRLVGTCLGCGIASAPPGVLPLLVNDSVVKNGAEYVFDEKGLLTARFEPKKK
jgi:hypothetical protein